MSAYMLRSDYYSRIFVGLTADKPSTPQKDGDIFLSIDDDEVYIGLGGSWNQMTSITVAL